MVTLFVTSLSCSDSTSEEPTVTDTGNDDTDGATIDIGADVLIDSPPYPE